MFKKSSDDRFNQAINIILKHEGGFVDSKSDPGGATNYGISFKFIKQSRIDLNLDGKIDLNDIIQLNEDEAKSLYKKYWWDKYHYNEINDLEVATKVFDLSVNMGPVKCHKILQKSLNDVNKYNIVNVNGILDKKTLIAINSTTSKLLLESIRQEAARFYINLVEVNPNLKKYLNGWLIRLNE